MWDLARRLVGRMSATGMDAMLSRQEHTCPSEPERAAFANNAGADLVLSLHTDANRSMYAQGLATFHFGNGTGSTSTVGEALAGLIQRELLIRTAMHDCRTPGRTWELLRLTRMPAVRIEVGYLSNMGDRAGCWTRVPGRRRRGHPRRRQTPLPARAGRSADRNLHFRDVLARELERDQAKAI
jgi:N-acetylmuramoyl-L-alanine amidase